MTRERNNGDAVARVPRAYPPPGQLAPRAIASWALRTRTDRVRIEGVQNVPRSGPVMLVARHYHRLLDGAILLRAVPRPLHLVVALNWARSPLERALTEWICGAAEYPLVAAATNFDGKQPRGSGKALDETTRLLRDGRVVVVFPQAYPHVDPTVAQMLAAAERDGITRVTVVPVGFTYTPTAPQRWSVTVRFGEACATREPDAIERAVRRLS